MFWKDKIIHRCMKSTDSNGVLTKEVTGWKKDDVQKNALGKKRPLLRKLPPGELSSGNMVHRKVSPRKSTSPPPPQKFPRWKLPPEKGPPKNCFSSFFSYFAVDIFKLFIVTSYRGVSSTPAAYVTDLCVTLINGMN